MVWLVGPMGTRRAGFGVKEKARLINGLGSAF